MLQTLKDYPLYVCVAWDADFRYTPEGWVDAKGDGNINKQRTISDVEHDYLEAIKMIEEKSKKK